ncbi:unnamed protein product, partial [Ceratitis capitata]
MLCPRTGSHTTIPNQDANVWRRIKRSNVSLHVAHCKFLPQIAAKIDRSIDRSIGRFFQLVDVCPPTTCKCALSSWRLYDQAHKWQVDQAIGQLSREAVDDGLWRCQSQSFNAATDMLILLQCACGRDEDAMRPRLWGCVACENCLKPVQDAQSGNQCICRKVISFKPTEVAQKMTLR